MWKHSGRFGGTRRWCWVLSGSGGSVRVCVCKCLCMCVMMYIAGNDCANLSRLWLQSKWAHTHTDTDAHTHACQHGLPCFVKVKCIQAGGNEKSPSTHPAPPLHSSGLSNIAAAPTTTTVKQQIYIQPHQPSCFFLWKCHFTFRSRVKIRGSAPRLSADFDSVRVLTAPSAHSPTSPPVRASSPLLRPPLHSTPLISRPLPLLSPHSHLSSRPACQDDFRLVASGLT